MDNKDNNNNSNKNNLNQVVALGCRLNFFEAELIKQQMNKAKLENTIVVNTCTVTSLAHAQSMQTIRKLKKNNPNAKIIVTGCGAQIDPTIYANMPEVEKVIGNKNKFSTQALLADQKIILDDFKNEASEHMEDNLSHNNQEDDYVIPKIKGFENKTRAFIQIQQGCDHKCTFCIIYQARGKSKSLSLKNIVEQIAQAVDFGHKEVVLTGVDISSWNRNAILNEPSKLGYLCKAILQQVKGLQRLRLSSLDPAVFDADILDLLANEERFMPHLHLSLQSLNDNVLVNMGRRHNKERAIDLINGIKRANPNTLIGADFIAGFPRETHEQHLDTYNTILELKIPFLHVFPYSTRAGTIAEKMQNVDSLEIKNRAKDLVKLGEQIKNEVFLNKIGTYQEILVEAKNIGYTKDYSLVNIKANTILPKGTLLMAKIIDSNNKNLIASM